MIVRAWYSNEGSAQGTPWRVEYEDGTFGLLAELKLYRANIVGVFAPEGAPLPDGPRAYLEIT